MNISGQEFIQAMSAIGAGIAMIAGVGPGVGQGIACLLYTSIINICIRHTAS